jgi:hypothetical protein
VYFFEIAGALRGAGAALAFVAAFLGDFLTAMPILFCVVIGKG